MYSVLIRSRYNIAQPLLNTPLIGRHIGVRVPYDRNRGQWPSKHEHMLERPRITQLFHRHK